MVTTSTEDEHLRSIANFLQAQEAAGRPTESGLPLKQSKQARKMASIQTAQFVLPPKRNSAIPIKKPGSKKEARPSVAKFLPSVGLACAISKESREVDEDNSPDVGTTAPNTTHIEFPSNNQRDETPKASDNQSGTVLCKLEAKDPREGPVAAGIKAQLASVISRQRLHLPTDFPTDSTRATGQEYPSPAVTGVLQENESNQPSTLKSPLINGTSSTLDIYAPNYVPEYLRAINDSTAQIRTSISLPLVNYAQYVASFAGYAVLRPLEPMVSPPIDKMASTSYNLDKDFDLHTYGKHLWAHMIRELHAQDTELQTLGIYGATFTPAQLAMNLYTFVIPGIRENNPRIDLGDTVLIRPWNQVPHEGLASLAKTWYASAGARSGRLAPGFAGWEYHAVVWGLQRSREEVVLRLDEFAPHNTRICNIGFIVQNQKCNPLYRAISHIASLINQEDRPKAWLRSMIFPAKIHGVTQSTLSRGSFDLAWYDKQLNFEQQKAVDAIVKNEYGHVPFIISGPPGTGKTKTLVEACLQLICSFEAKNESCHVLAHLDQFELLRLNSWARSFAEVPEHLLLYSYIENDLFAIPDFATMMRFKVIVTTSRDADMLVQGRLTNVDLATLTTQLSVITSSASPQPLRLHWSALLLDEAAQATEPEALIPLTVIQPGAEPREGFQSLPQLVMAGDEHQLGPRLFLKSNAGLRLTLFQRLVARPLYAGHPLSRKNGSKPLTSGMLPMLRAPFTNLVRNYRSHPAILAIPSVLFYHDSLIPEITMISDGVSSWQGWKGRYRRPVLFIQNESEDAVESILAGNGSGAGALVNYGEAILARRIVQSLVKSPDLPKLSDPAFDNIKPYEITVMSPFRAQVNLLRQELRGSGFAAVNVGPLEAFQGLESKVVIICSTRTRRDVADASRFVQEDQARGIGIIGDEKKFNVAITRAREGLIVIGDRKTLLCTGDRAWGAFLAFCDRNECVDQSNSKDKGKWGSTSSDVLPGRLERAMAYAAEAKEKEAKITDAPTGFRYPTPSGRVLRGNLPTEDEDMWADGMKMAEEDTMGEEDEEEYDLGEVVKADVYASSETTPVMATINACSELINVAPKESENKQEAKLISLSQSPRGRRMMQKESHRQETSRSLTEISRQRSRRKDVKCSDGYNDLRR